MKRSVAFVIVRIIFIIICICLLCGGARSQNAPQAIINQRIAWITHRIAKEFPTQQAAKILQDPRLVLNPTIFKGSGTADYSYILQESYLADGELFLQAYHDRLQKISADSGIAPEFIVGFFAIESDFCTNTGKVPALTSLYTRAVLERRPKRRKFAQDQLLEFLKLSLKNHWDLGKVRGSNWGAIGCGQFMPTSYRELARTCEGGYNPPLLDIPDTICSIRNYLANAGWTDEPFREWRAVFAYNHDSAYADAIFKFAHLLKLRPQQAATPKVAAFFIVVPTAGFEPATLAL